MIVVAHLGITLGPVDKLVHNKYAAFMDNFLLSSLVPLVVSFSVLNMSRQDIHSCFLDPTNSRSFPDMFQAMYPMAIIIIVTINQSPIDHLYTSLQSYY